MFWLLEKKKYLYSQNRKRALMLDSFLRMVYICVYVFDITF